MLLRNNQRWWWHSLTCTTFKSFRPANYTGATLFIPTKSAKSFGRSTTDQIKYRCGFWSKPLPLDNSLWRGTLKNSQLEVISDVESTLYFETICTPYSKVRFIEVRKLVLYWKWLPMTIKESQELRSILGLYLEMDLNRGLEFQTDSTSSWEIRQKNRELSAKKRMIQQERGNPVPKNWESHHILMR